MIGIFKRQSGSADFSSEDFDSRHFHTETTAMKGIFRGTLGCRGLLKKVGE